MMVPGLPAEGGEGGPDSIMKIEIIELSEGGCHFLLSDVDVAFANSIRRCMIADIPTLAITEVNIYENDSVLFDEQLALRLGMIPLTTDLKSYVLESECKCKGEGCPLCKVSLNLSVEAPKIVYSGDFITGDPEVHASYDNIPIVELMEGNKIVLEAVARLGRGRDHARWQSTAACGYKNMPKIVVNDTCDACGDCVEECPRNILEIISKKGLSVTDVKKCSMCHICEDVCSVGAISVDKEEDVFVFSFESTGAHPTESIPSLAAECLKEKAEQFKNILEAM